jgi:prepilin-type N-terminal cleavage/methylation domain-containing protein
MESKPNMNKIISRKRGFTLIELLVVVLILGILVAVALPSYLSSVRDSRAKTANTNAKTILNAVQALYVKSGGNAYNAASINATTIAAEVGGAIPTNPCTGEATLATYGFVATATSATVEAANGTLCDDAATTPFSVSGG